MTRINILKQICEDIILPPQPFFKRHVCLGVLGLGCCCLSSSVCLHFHPPPLWACSNMMHKFRPNFTPHYLRFEYHHTPAVPIQLHSTCLSAPDQKHGSSFLCAPSTLMCYNLSSRLHLNKLWFNVFEVGKGGRKCSCIALHLSRAYRCAHSTTRRK